MRPSVRGSPCGFWGGWQREIMEKKLKTQFSVAIKTCTEINFRLFRNLLHITEIWGTGHNYTTKLS